MMTRAHLYNNKEKYTRVSPWAMEWITIAYMLFTTVLIGVYWNGLADPVGMLRTRGLMVVWIAAFYSTHRRRPDKVTSMMRWLPPMCGLIFWYPETYDFCSQLPYLDHVFAGIDQTLFGCQPALEFSKAVPGVFWSEAFCCGYYAYYYMMVGTLLFYLLCRYDQADRAGFIFLMSFFMFYIIYEFLPVAGPQYYFKAIGVDAATTGVFPEIGNYFQTHHEAFMPEDKGIFSHLVISAQEIGERPTAAFPSSHVGMSAVSMMLAYRTRNRWLFWGMMPLFVLLCCATVYIKAHYLIDSICGFIAAVLFYFITSRLYDRFVK